LADATLVRVATVMTSGVATVVVSGDLDAVSMSVLSARLAEVIGQQPRRLVFDLAQVSFIDCAATRLITGSAGILPAGGRPVLRRPSAAVRRLLDLTDLGVGCEVED
jgi:anti-anti-sigma factor